MRRSYPYLAKLFCIAAAVMAQWPLAHQLVSAQTDDGKPPVPSYLNDALKADPSNWQALEMRGAVYRERKEFNQAIADFNKALSLLKGQQMQAQIFYERGKCYDAMKEYTKAVADYQQAINVMGQTRVVSRYIMYSTMCRLCESYTKMRQYDKAIASGQTALNYDTSTAEAYLALGSCYLAKRDCKQALYYFDRGTKAMGVPTVALFYRANAFELCGQKKEAIADYKLYIERERIRREKKLTTEQPAELAIAQKKILELQKPETPAGKKPTGNSS